MVFVWVLLNAVPILYLPTSITLLSERLRLSAVPNQMDKPIDLWFGSLIFHVLELYLSTHYSFINHGFQMRLLLIPAFFDCALNRGQDGIQPNEASEGKGGKEARIPKITKNRCSGAQIPT